MPTPDITAPISDSGNRFAQFKTEPFDDGVVVSTAEQPFIVDAEEPILGFDFTLAEFVPDPTGDAMIEMSDRVNVIIDDGENRFVLLTIDQSGATENPNGNAPGETMILDPMNPDEFDFGFRADLSSLIERDVTLLIDVINEDDGFRLDPNFDNFGLRVPDSTSMMLWIGMWALVWRRRSAARN